MFLFLTYSNLANGLYQNEYFTRITPLTSNGGAKIKPKRHKFSNNDIHESLRPRFTSHLIPLMRELAGTLPPWTLLDLEQKQSLVSRVWPEYRYTVRTNDVIFDLVCGVHVLCSMI